MCGRIGDVVVVDMKEIDSETESRSRGVAIASSEKL